MKPVKLVRFFLPGALFLSVMAPLPVGRAEEAAKPEPAKPEPAKPGPAAGREEKPAATQPAGKPGVIRIKAGVPVAVTDADGNEWEGERGFDDGHTEERGRMTIEGAPSPDLYRSERWGMTRFTLPVPNGKYTLRLHFCETWDGITGPGGRVFDVRCGEKQIKDLDIYKEAGGPRKPLVRTLETTVTNGKLEIEFVEHPEHNHPEINAIEIVPS